MYAGGADMFEGYTALFKGAFGSVGAISETLVKMVPLLIISMGLLMAYRAGVWNIGAEGQFYSGALMATVVGLYFQAPFPIPLILMLIGGFLGGLIWGFIPGFLKAKFGMNEILTTLMLNYVIAYFISYLLYNPLMDPASVVPQTTYITQDSWMPRLLAGTRLHVGIIIALLWSVLTFILVRKTTLGYSISVTRNVKCARYSGINVAKYIIIAMVLSGAFAGLAGGIEVSAIHHRLRGDISPGYGFIGVLIAVMGNLNVVWVTLVAFIYSGIMVGSSAMQIVTGVHTSISFIIQGIIPIIFLVVRFLGTYKITLKSEKILKEDG